MLNLPTPVIYIAVAVVIFFIMYQFSALNKKIAADFKQALDKAALNKHYTYITIKKLWLTRGERSTYISSLPSVTLYFADIDKGDFQETQWLMVAHEGIEIFPTREASTKAYKPFKHFALAEITLDKTGMLTLESRALPSQLPDLMEKVHIDFVARKVIEENYNTPKELLNALQKV